MITESEGREMEAGAELDAVCARFMGWFLLKQLPPNIKSYYDHDAKVYAANHTAQLRLEGNWPDYSTDWAAAGPLLEAMRLPYDSLIHGWTKRGFGVGVADLNSTEWQCGQMGYGGEIEAIAFAPTPQLAIARACAVLVSRGITRGDL